MVEISEKMGKEAGTDFSKNLRGKPKSGRIKIQKSWVLGNETFSFSCSPRNFEEEF